jgi:proline iminopeptidase
MDRSDMIAAYYRHLTSPDPAVRLTAGKAWSRWEMATSRLMVDPVYLQRAEADEWALAFSRIECHYFLNGVSG